MVEAMGGPYWLLLRELPRSGCVSSECQSRVCRGSFRDSSMAVVRRLTVGVDEASGAVCVGDFQ
jgi:hypothetical protein